MATSTKPINFTFPLKRSSSGGFASNYTTLDAVASDLKILILTNHGERPIHYDYGANLRSLIFEPIDSPGARKEIVRDRIIVAVDKWMPFVNIIDIIVDDQSTQETLGRNEIHVSIEFSVGNIHETQILKQKIRAA